MTQFDHDPPAFLKFGHAVDAGSNHRVPPCGKRHLRSTEQATTVLGLFLRTNAFIIVIMYIPPDRLFIPVGLNSNFVVGNPGRGMSVALAKIVYLIW